MNPSVYLSDRSHPYIRLKVLGVDEDMELDCMVDTGFAGGVTIPSYLEDEVSFVLIGSKVWELADGSQIELDIFAGEVDFMGNKREIAIIFTDSKEALVGIEFLKGMRFVLDLKKQQVELS